MKRIVEEARGFEVSQVERGDSTDECHIQIVMTVPWDWYEMIAAGASSAGVSLQEYVTECAKDGLVRGYR
jgi:hypothetical protein